MIKFEKHRSVSHDYLYRQYNKNLTFAAHFHDSYELIYVYEGEINVTVEKNTFTITKGNSILILPNQIHSYTTNNYSKTFIIIFSSSYVSAFSKTSSGFYALNPAITINDDLLKILENENDIYLLKSIFYYIVYLYNQKNLIRKEFVNNNLIQKILTYIENNFTKEISLDSLSKELGYDYHYLSNCINNHLNTNFQTLLNEYRINQFCELEEESTSNSIKELAYQCGYTSLRTFNRNFLSIKKCTPKEYINNKKLNS